MGKNTVAQAGKRSATWLKLDAPERFTYHCWKRTAATHLADVGASTVELKRKFHWKNDQTAMNMLMDLMPQK